MTIRITIGRRAARCGCPACSPEESWARAAVGMLRLHPERIATGLPGQRERRRLAALEARLWPDGEWSAIAADVRRGEGQP
jgi:hypothetical protein